MTRSRYRLVLACVALGVLQGCAAPLLVGAATGVGNLALFSVADSQAEKAIKAGYPWCSNIPQPTIEYTGKPCLRRGDEVLVFYNHRLGPRQEGAIPYVSGPSPAVQPARAPAPAPRR